ncbi:unnamed protein product [Protopolystoma xenopodis]|uniref:Uncharacterized protein n=1 Tax=Protopolystoma xenopodis TaxID=117903 RepID=A0A3S5A874_9PLAT|nr:unnamed protein product [Protopolystoma xenopodis]
MKIRLDSGNVLFPLWPHFDSEGHPEVRENAPILFEQTTGQLSDLQARPDEEATNTRKPQLLITKIRNVLDSFYLLPGAPFCVWFQA